MFSLSARLVLEIAPAVGRCNQERVVPRLVTGDATLWGTEIEQDVQTRLGWVDPLADARDLVPEIEALRERIANQGLNRIVLCGMGGSSLAPEVICRHAGVELLVLDSSHPDTVSAALTDIARTCVVVSSKSGSTLETESHLHEFVRAFEDSNLPVADHIIVVTDAGSAFESFAQARDIQVFRGNARVGGRYSALTAFGLVPSGLAGADISRLINEADSMLTHICTDDGSRSVAALGSAMALAGEDELGVLAIHPGHHEGLGNWIEQLVAESLGKSGRGVLPIMVDSDHTYVPADGLHVVLGSDASTKRSVGHLSIHIDEPLGAQLLLWEYATAIAGFLMDVDPFDQPNVEASKLATREVLADFASASKPDFIDGSIRGWGCDARNLDAAIAGVKAQVDPRGFVALCWYLDRWRLEGIETIASDLSARVERPVSFGWGPRYLHSTGQLHKGGPSLGSFIHVSAVSAHDFPVADQGYSWGELLESQVRGDARVLRDLKRPVLRLELHDVAHDIPRLLEALRS
ncbi:MAG: glucose-6-phosphate isomerase [Actinomycetales bacterium]|nr:glucose-6-phosphate isomerase [Actinomycetales bacterium]